MTTLAPGTPTLPLRGATPEAIATAVNAALSGKLNSFGTVMLGTSVGSTTVLDPRVGVNSAVFLFPQTANAAAELGNGTAYIAPADHVNKTSFKITHANSATTGRTFFWLLIG